LAAFVPISEILVPDWIVCISAKNGHSVSPKRSTRSSCLEQVSRTYCRMRLRSSVPQGGRTEQLGSLLASNGTNLATPPGHSQLRRGARIWPCRREVIAHAKDARAEDHHSLQSLTFKQNLGMMLNVTSNERRDEEIGMIVAVAESQIDWLLCLLACRREEFRLQLGRQERILRPLID
jgi:hypothetical protein